jgi:hypothetical protein
MESVLLKGAVKQKGMYASRLKTSLVIQYSLAMGIEGTTRMKEKDERQKPPLDATEAHVELYNIYLNGGKEALLDYAKEIAEETEEKDNPCQ